MAPRRRERSCSRTRGVRREMPGRCYKPGPVTRSPFLNYVRNVRMRMSGARLTEITKRAGAEWRRMTDEQKQPYVRQAQEARSSRPGPTTRSPFLNKVQSALNRIRRANNHIRLAHKLIRRARISIRGAHSQIPPSAPAPSGGAWPTSRSGPSSAKCKRRAEPRPPSKR